MSLFHTHTHTLSNFLFYCHVSLACTVWRERQRNGERKKKLWRDFNLSFSLKYNCREMTAHYYCMLLQCMEPYKKERKKKAQNWNLYENTLASFDKNYIFVTTSGARSLLMHTLDISFSSKSFLSEQVPQLCGATFPKTPDWEWISQPVSSHPPPPPPLSRRFLCQYLSLNINKCF